MLTHWPISYPFVKARTYQHVRCFCDFPSPWFHVKFTHGVCSVFLNLPSSLVVTLWSVTVCCIIWVCRERVIMTSDCDTLSQPYHSRAAAASLTSQRIELKTSLLVYKSGSVVPLRRLSICQHRHWHLPCATHLLTEVCWCLLLDCRHVWTRHRTVYILL